MAVDNLQLNLIMDVDNLQLNLILEFTTEHNNVLQN